ncbi:MAG: hypothetical protein NTY74_06540 [Ignavibacteriae bacterium]|nr:hypothetical protein [Ignavibacteriota bacterium]
MKTLMLIVLFVLLPLVFVNAQDKKVAESKTQTGYTIAWKDITCPDCQGWGWILGEGFKNTTNASYSGNGSGQPATMRGVSNSSVDRYKCMDCNGTGKIQVKYYKSDL